mgnify:FL=1
MPIGTPADSLEVDKLVEAAQFKGPPGERGDKGPKGLPGGGTLGTVLLPGGHPLLPPLGPGGPAKPILPELIRFNAENGNPPIQWAQQEGKVYYGEDPDLLPLPPGAVVSPFRRLSTLSNMIRFRRVGDEMQVFCSCYDFARTPDSDWGSGSVFWTAPPDFRPAREYRFPAVTRYFKSTSSSAVAESQIIVGADGTFRYDGLDPITPLPFVDSLYKGASARDLLPADCFVYLFGLSSVRYACP